MATKGPRKLRKGIETYEDFDFDELNLYAGIDTIVTLDLLKALMPALTHRPRYRSYVGGVMSEVRAPDVFTELIDVKALALEFTCDLKICGMHYDIEANRAMGLKMQADMAQTKEVIDDIAGIDVPMSGGDFYNYLYRTRGYVSEIKTKNGDDATSGDALESLAESYPEDEDLLHAMKRFIDVRAMFNGFINGYVEKFVKYDSRIHCDYLLHGTSSHRISSQNPNLLNMPRGYYGYNIRDLYTATPGYTLLAFDFSSCEVKILAALSGDENMIYACEQGYDFHSFSASLMMGISYEEFLRNKHIKEFKDQRQYAKTVGGGLLQ